MRKEVIQNLDSFFISLYDFITLTNHYFSLEIIMFDNNGVTFFRNFLLLHAFFLLKIFKHSLFLFSKSVTQKFLCLWYLLLFIFYLILFFSVQFLRKIFLSFVFLHDSFGQILIHERQMIIPGVFFYGEHSHLQSTEAH